MLQYWCQTNAQAMLKKLFLSSWHNKLSLATVQPVENGSVKLGIIIEQCDKHVIMGVIKNWIIG